ncbi:hypothetical protein PG988_013068 [Apiospora saccharicola]
MSEPSTTREILVLGSVEHHVRSPLPTLLLQGAGALQSLFRHPPPDVDPDAIHSRQLEEAGASFWGYIAEAARDESVITEQDMWKWIVALEDLDEEELRRAEREKAAKQEWQQHLQYLQEQEEESE